jgi:hypothetical protein
MGAMDFWSNMCKDRMDRSAGDVVAPSFEPAQGPLPANRSRAMYSTPTTLVMWSGSSIESYWM